MASFSVVANTVRVRLGSFGDWLYGCNHRQTSFPITLRAGPCMDGQPETYIVCLTCGRRLPYDWTTMRISKKASRRVMHQFVGDAQSFQDSRGVRADR